MEETIDELVRSVSCSKIELPIIYLGVPLGSSPRSRSFLEGVVNKKSDWRAEKMASSL